MKKLRSPYFVSAEILKNGMVKLVDDDGEVYHVEMHPDKEGPFLSCQVRKRQMRATYEEMKKTRRIDSEPPKPVPPFIPKLVS